MKQPRSILFVQLPLLDHGYFYINGNVDYAPASMTAYLKRHFGQTIACESLPFILANFASNNVIVHYLRAMRPDIIAFTSYLWNIERNLDIALAVKEYDPHCTIIFGGPEIAADSWALTEHRKAVDCFVIGEGEWFFERLLSGIDMNGSRTLINENPVYIQPSDELIPASAIVEPFTEGYLNTMMDGSTFLELVRGCPYRCAYCNYSKNSPGVRELPFERLPRAIEIGPSFRLNEIYILAPTFNRSERFIPNLERLASMRHDVRLHTEMRTDGIDADTAALMYAAGFRSLEVGLQTLNNKALQTVGRKALTDAELAGMAALRDSGIDLKIGIIPGLPGDSPKGFKQTVDRLIDDGFGDFIELYPLLVLPGTRMRDLAGRRNASFQDKPPYFFTRGWGFDHDAIRDIIDYTHEATGYDYSSRRLPGLISGTATSITGGIRINGDSTASWDGTRYRDRIDTNVFTFIIALTTPALAPDGLRLLLTSLPGDVLYHIVIGCDCILPEERISQTLSLSDRDNLTRRMNLFEDDTAQRTCRLYQVFSTVERYAAAMQEYSLIEPIFRLTTENLDAIPHLTDFDRLGLVLADGVYPHVREYLINEFRDFPDRLAFESEAELERFFLDTGAEYVRYPLSPRILSM